jgi:DNA-binding CsgD family transcriptional regulator
MVAWTVLATRLYVVRAPHPGPFLLLVDLALAVGAVLGTRAALSSEHIAAGDPTLPVSWAAAPVLAWAVAAGPLGGALAGLGVAAADLVERWSAPSEVSKTPQLTDRETEVLRLVAKGLTYKEIAERLVCRIGPFRTTCRTHWRRCNCTTRHSLFATQWSRVSTSSRNLWP